MSVRNLYLVSYDISNNTRRARVLRELKAVAVGGQKSVYECWFDDAGFTHARDTLRAHMRGEHDRLVMIRLDPRAQIHTLGIGIAPQDGNYFYYG